MELMINLYLNHYQMDLAPTSLMPEVINWNDLRLEKSKVDLVL